MRSSKSTCVWPGACSGRFQLCFGSTSSGRGCTLVRSTRLAIDCLLERQILSGDEFDAPLDTRCGFAVPRVLGSLCLHAKPGEKRPAPALRRSNIDRIGNRCGSDPTGLELHRRGNEARKRLAASRMPAMTLQIFSIGKLIGASAVAERFEARARVVFEARGAHRAAHKLRTRDEIGAPGGAERLARAPKLCFSKARVAGEIGALEGLQCLRRLELPLRRAGRAAATAEHNDQGNRISVSRRKGHLRLMSSINPATFCRLASTS